MLARKSLEKKWIFFSNTWIRTESIKSIRKHDDIFVIDILCTPYTSFNYQYQDLENMDMAYENLCNRLGIND